MSIPHSAIGDALFTKTQQRVLGLLYGAPEQSYYVNELIRLADMGKGTVRRELEKLCSVGLVTVSKQGNQSHYQANPLSPIFTELKAIIDKTFGVVAALSSALQPVLADMEFAFIYGSIAKGEEHSASDIDLMLVGGGISYTATMDLLLPAGQQLGRKINPTIYSQQEFDDRLKKQQSFLNRVLLQNTLWLHGEEAFSQQYQEFTNRG